MQDDELTLLDEPSPSDASPSRSAVLSEALTLLLEGSLPRLILLLVWLGFTAEARQLIAMQANVLGVLTSPKKRRGV